MIFALSAAGRKRWPSSCVIDQFHNGLLLPGSVCRLAQGLLSKAGMAGTIQMSREETETVLDL